MVRVDQSTAGGAKSENARVSEVLKEAAAADAGLGKEVLGLRGRVRHCIDAATKASRLGLLDGAVDAG